VFDGWNRLVQVKTTGGSVIASYEYDGREFRIEKAVTASSTTWDHYHNEASQVVEVRKNDTTSQVYVWDLSYVDTPVMSEMGFPTVLDSNSAYAA
jgi:YD repeat-containing protein